MVSARELGDELADALRASAEVTRYVDDRIYPQIRVQDDKTPALVYSYDGQGAPITQDGGMTLRRQAWQVICFADRYKTLEELEAVVAETLSAHVSPAIREILISGGTTTTR